MTTNTNKSQTSLLNQFDRRWLLSAIKEKLSAEMQVASKDGNASIDDYILISSRAQRISNALNLKE